MNRIRSAVTASPVTATIPPSLSAPARSGLTLPEAHTSANESDSTAMNSQPHPRDLVVVIDAPSLDTHLQRVPDCTTILQNLSALHGQYDAINAHLYEYSWCHSLKHARHLEDDGIVVVRFAHSREAPLQAAICEQLRALQQVAADVVFVGHPRSNEQLELLRKLRDNPDGTPRELAIAMFDFVGEFDPADIKHLDLVHDLHAAPTRVYDARKAAVTVAAVAETPHGDHSRPDTEDVNPNAPLEERPSPQSGRPLIILIDMENIDHGVAALTPSGKPERAFRPHWDRLQQFAMNHTHGAQVRLVPFLQYHGTVPAFARYMRRELGAHPVVLNPEYSPDRPSQRRSVVDEAIYAVLNELVDRVTDVAIVSNDGGYLPRLQALRENGIDADRRFLMIGLREQMSRAYSDTEWIETLDLEHDIGAFDRELPSRFVLTDIDDFDPAAALGDFGLPAPPEHDDEAAGH